MQSLKKPDETYVGSTGDLKRRVKEHNNSTSPSTKRYAPWQLVMYEAYQSEDDARERESKLKSHGNAMKELKNRSRRSLKKAVGSPSTIFTTHSSGRQTKNEGGASAKHCNNKKYKNGAGFTLMEVIVVMGMMAVIVAAGMAFTFDSYQGYLFRAEYTNVAHVLSKARNRAANNFHQSAHGVEFLSDKYVLFVGTSYTSGDPDNEEFPKSQEFSITGPNTIVFEQLSGSVQSCDVSPCTITFDGGGVRYRELEVNEVGGIIW